MQSHVAFELVLLECRPLAGKSPAEGLTPAEVLQDMMFCAGLMGDFKTAYITLCNPRSMFIAQVNTSDAELVCTGICWRNSAETPTYLALHNRASHI